MSILKQHAIDGLRRLREDFLAIDKDDLTFERLSEVLRAGNAALLRAGPPLGPQARVMAKMRGYDSEVDPEILGAIRAELVAQLDYEIGNIGPTADALSPAAAATLTGAGNFTANAEVVPGAATRPSSFELKISERPADIRDAARVLAAAIADQVAKLRASTPNALDDLARHNEYLGFLEKLANGLTSLADALDRAADANANGSSKEPIFLGEAGKIAQQLSIDLMEWITLHHADAVGFFMTATVFAAGYDFLAACGVQGGIAAIVSGLLTKSFSQKNRNARAWLRLAERNAISCSRLVPRIQPTESI